jgi:hypothetical protein
MNGSQRIRGECREYNIMEVLNIEQDTCLEDQSFEIGCLEEGSELFLCENCLEVMRVDINIVLIPLFGVDVPAYSEGIRFHAKLSKGETNYHIELGEEL